MELENIKRIAVIGAGTMGSQIATLLSRVGKYSVTMMDVDKEMLNSAFQRIRSDLKQYFVDKGKITQIQMEEVIARINGTTSITEAAKDADFIIEAVTENLEVKKKVFSELDKIARPDVIFASNTSGLSITEMASVTKRPNKVVGMHFFNPVAVMKLVEVVKGAFTSDATVNIVCALAKRLGKEPVVCLDVSYGFLANRAYSAMMREAVQMVWERVATPEDIDKALKLGYNLPVGPLELGDMVGSWAIWASSEPDRIRELGAEKGQLHPLVRWMVRAGYTGGPGKKGIYDFWREVLSKS
ncbi:MAG: 3-hydroxyacyl-CoA dehydrogenase family protein, partial [Candidatus Baldrarchaeia archaeon]